MKTLTLLNGMIVLNNAFGKEMADYNEPVRNQKTPKLKEYHKKYFQMIKKRIKNTQRQ